MGSRSWGQVLHLTSKSISLACETTNLSVKERLMARPLRIEFSGSLYHVTARGNARQAIYADDTDRTLFLKLLERPVVDMIGTVMPTV